MPLASSTVGESAAGSDVTSWTDRSGGVRARPSVGPFASAAAADAVAVVALEAAATAAADEVAVAVADAAAAAAAVVVVVAAAGAPVSVWVVADRSDDASCADEPAECAAPLRPLESPR
jgi:hypothetical protein